MADFFEMRHGCLREGKGLPTLDEQRAALAAAGVEAQRTHVMGRRKRGRPNGEPSDFDYLLMAARDGDEIAVASAACLGVNKAEIVARLLGICTAGRALYDCEAGVVVRGEEEVARFLGRAERGLAYAQTANARKKLEETGRIKTSEAKRNKMMPDWKNPKMTAAQVALKWGMKRRQMFNIFRGVPKA